MISPYLVDDIGPIFSDLGRAVIDLQRIDPVRLTGDRATIASAIVGLTLVLNRINVRTQRELQAAE